MIVSPMPGTTRDPVDSIFTWHRKKVRIVDTAGIRKAGRVARGGAVEIAERAAGAARRSREADVVVLVDRRAGRRHRPGRGDRRRGRRRRPRRRHRAQQVGPGRGPQPGRRARRSTTRCAAGCSSSTTRRSCTSRRATGERTPKLLEVIDRVATERRRRVPTPELNRFIAPITAAHPPVADGPARGARAVRRADRRRAADLRALHERRGRRCTSPTCAISPTGCARNTASKARRSGCTCAAAPRARKGIGRSTGPDPPCYTPIFRRSGAGRAERADTTCMVAPKLERLKAADVCQIAQVQPYVLRTLGGGVPGPWPGDGRRAADLRSRRCRARAADSRARLRRRAHAGRRPAPARGVGADDVDRVDGGRTSSLVDAQTRTRLQNVRQGLQGVLDAAGTAARAPRRSNWWRRRCPTRPAGAPKSARQAKR